MDWSGQFAEVDESIAEDLPQNAATDAIGKQISLVYSIICFVNSVSNACVHI